MILIQYEFYISMEKSISKLTFNNAELFKYCALFITAVQSFDHSYR